MVQRYGGGLSQSHLGGEPLGRLPVGLSFLGAIYPVQADTYSLASLEDFDGVTVEDLHNEASEARQGKCKWEQREYEDERQEDPAWHISLRCGMISRSLPRFEQHVRNLIAPTIHRQIVYGQIFCAPVAIAHLRFNDIG